MTTAGPPLLPGRARPAAVVVVAVAVAVVTALGVKYAGMRRAGSTDRQIRDWLLQLHVSEPLAEHVANLGDPTPVVVMVAVLAVALAALRRWRLALLALLAAPTGAAITEWMLKPLFGRTLHRSLTYPSGHSTATCAIALVVVLALLDRRSPRLPVAVAVALSVVVSAVALCVAVALVITDRHYATDTVGGAGVGIATVLILALAVDQGAALISRPGRVHAGAGVGTDAP